MDPAAPTLSRRRLVLLFALACVPVAVTAGPVCVRTVAVVADIAWLYLSNAAG